MHKDVYLPHPRILLLLDQPYLHVTYTFSLILFDLNPCLFLGPPPPPQGWEPEKNFGAQYFCGDDFRFLMPRCV